MMPMMTVDVLGGTIVVKAMIFRQPQQRHGQPVPEDTS